MPSEDSRHTSESTAPPYRYRLPSPQDYLHHRPPYLMIDAIDQIEDVAIDCHTKILGNEPYITGHFPGAPIVPGAMMQEMTTQAAGILLAANFNPMPSFDTQDPFFNDFALGVLVKIKSARYRGFARPGQTLSVRAELAESFGNVFDFVGRITIDGKLILRNEFQLSNIPSQTLQGKS